MLPRAPFTQLSILFQSSDLPFGYRRRRLISTSARERQEDREAKKERESERNGC